MSDRPAPPAGPASLDVNDLGKGTVMLPARVSDQLVHGWVRTVLPFALALLAACNDIEDPDDRVLGPEGVVTAGEADFTRYAAIGDSYAAGVVNGAFTCSGQIHSYPTQIARRVGLPVADTCAPPEELAEDFSSFQQPLVTDPGVGTPLVLTTPGPPPVVTPVAATGIPTNGDLPRPYNNLGVPGADLREVNVARNAATSLDGNAAFNIVLRGRGTAPAEVRAMEATFVTFWLGGNDALGPATSGTSQGLTQRGVFDNTYNLALDALLAVTPDVVVANLSDVTILPFFTTIPAVVVDPATGQPVLVNGQPVRLIGPNGQLRPGQDLVTLRAAALLAAGIGIPTALGGTGLALPDSVVLLQAEVNQIETAIDNYNQTIATAAALRGLTLVDIDAATAAALAAGGIVNANGQPLSIAFLGGGAAAPFFGLDGIHPTPKGYGHFANLFITAINARYGAAIPLVDVSTLPTLIGPAPAGGDRVASLPEVAAAGAAPSRNVGPPVIWPAEVDLTLW